MSNFHILKDFRHLTLGIFLAIPDSKDERKVKQTKQECYYTLEFQDTVNVLLHYFILATFLYIYLYVHIFQGPEGGNGPQGIAGPPVSD